MGSPRSSRNQCSIFSSNLLISQNKIAGFDGRSQQNQLLMSNVKRGESPLKLEREPADSKGSVKNIGAKSESYSARDRKRFLTVINGWYLLSGSDITDQTGQNGLRVWKD